MVSTIKFSQMISGGDIANNALTPGLASSTNVLFNNPWTFLAQGGTAERPPITPEIYFRLRLNTDLQAYEYYDSATAMWTELAGSGTGTVNPGVANDIAYYASNGTTVSALPSAINSVLVTSDLGIPSISNMLPPGLVAPDFTITSPLTVNSGGTGLSSLNAYQVLAGGTSPSGPIQQIANGTASGQVLSYQGPGSLPVYSAVSYPPNTFQYEILYSTLDNVVNGIPAATNSVLVSNGSGLPSWSTTLPGPLLSTNMTLITPTITDAVSISFGTTAEIIGTTTNDNADVGSVGEVSYAVRTVAGAIPLITSTPEDVFAVPLSAGDWDVWGNVTFIGGNFTAVTNLKAWISTVSATYPDDSTTVGPSFNSPGDTPFAQGNYGISIMPTRLSLAGVDTIYISIFADFTVSTLSVCGQFFARRRR